MGCMQLHILYGLRKTVEPMLVESLFPLLALKEQVPWVLQLQRNEFCQQHDRGYKCMLPQLRLWWDPNPGQHLDLSLTQMGKKKDSETRLPIFVYCDLLLSAQIRLWNCCYHFFFSVVTMSQAIIHLGNVCRKKKKCTTRKHPLSLSLSMAPGPCLVSISPPTFSLHHIETQPVSDSHPEISPKKVQRW